MAHNGGVGGVNTGLGEVSIWLCMLDFCCRGGGGGGALCLDRCFSVSDVAGGLCILGGTLARERLEASFLSFILLFKTVYLRNMK